MIKRTERGWPGHFICSDECKFSRNTLLENGKTKIIVSTVGRWLSKYGVIQQIRPGAYFETMAFYARYDSGYWLCNVQMEVTFESPGLLNSVHVGKADFMHEKVVDEISLQLENGRQFKKGEWA